MDCKDLRDQAAQPPASEPPRVLAAVSDLMFVSKISAAAKQAGCPVEFFCDGEKLKQAAAAASPCLVIVDLNDTRFDSVPLIANLKDNPATRQATVIAYLSHVQHELKREAEKAGADLVLPRSAFSQNLYDILRQRSCHL